MKPKRLTDLIKDFESGEADVYVTEALVEANARFDFEIAVEYGNPPFYVVLRGAQRKDGSIDMGLVQTTRRADWDLEIEGGKYFDPSSSDDRDLLLFLFSILGIY